MVTCNVNMECHHAMLTCKHAPAMAVDKIYTIYVKSIMVYMEDGGIQHINATSTCKLKLSKGKINKQKTKHTT